MINLLRHFNVCKEKVLFLYQGVTDPQWTPSRYDALSEEGYQKNVYAFRAINLIAKGIASIPISLRDRESKKENETLNKIFKRPNELQTRSSFLENVVGDLLISGNAFVHCSDINELHCLRTDRVQIIPNKTRTAVSSYTYCVDSSKFSIEKDDVLHLKFFNPLNDWYGFSPLQAASQAIDQYNEMSKHNLSILQNGGRPSGCLVVKNAENLTSEQRQQLRSDIQEAYTGTTNSGRVMVLEGGLEWKEMGLSPKDMDFNTGKNITAREISQAFGVPPLLLGISGDSSFSSYREARLHFWEDTVLPLVEFIRLEFENWLSLKFQQNVEMIFDLETIHALISQRENLWHKISSADFLTINEKREILGYPPIKQNKIGEKI
ncbi:MAG: phage portal protein [Holosporaceae bacterium]|jgi:HK97 family phage portal protein|nr:phage portal protein [Holosporaceae bacterium]